MDKKAPKGFMRSDHTQSISDLMPAFRFVQSVLGIASILALLVLVVPDKGGAQYLSPIPPQDPSFVPPPRGIVGDNWADLILGQFDFSDITPNQVTANRVDSPAGVVVDRLNNRMYVWDAANSRVLGIDIGKLSSNYAASQPGFNADVVLGQPDFNHSGCNWDGNFQNYPVTTGPSAYSLCGQPPNTKSPEEGGSTANMAVDPQGDLYVPDVWNDRILRYNAPVTTGEPAAYVWGQGASVTNFYSMVRNENDSTTPTNDGVDFAESSNQPYRVIGVAVDSHGNLWTTDLANNRVLRFPVDPISHIPQAVADVVLGQADFTSNTNAVDPSDKTHLAGPSAVRVDDNDNVFVTDLVGPGGCDNHNGRILVFESTGTGANGEPAYGPGNTNLAATTIITSPNYMPQPIGLEFDAPAPAGLGMNGLWVNCNCDAKAVLFNVNISGATVTAVPDKVLMKDQFPVTTECGESSRPTGDNGNPSFFYTYPAGSSLAAWNLCGTQGSVGVDNAGDVFISSGDEGVFEDVWRFKGPIPTPQTGIVHSADVAIFKPLNLGVQNNMTTASMNSPDGVAVDSDDKQLVVADKYRLMFWNMSGLGAASGLSNGTPASGLFGTDTPFEQNNNLGFQRIREDKALPVHHLWSIVNNQQIRVYNFPVTNGALPARTLFSPLPLLGGGSFSWTNGTIAGIAVDPNAHYIWLSDTNNNRVFRVRNPLTNPVVDIVLGQTTPSGTGCNGSGTFPQGGFLCSNSNPTAYTLDAPGAVSLDHEGNLYVSDDSYETNGNYRLLRFNFSTVQNNSQTNVLADVAADQVYGTPGDSLTAPSETCSGIPFDPCAPWEPGFTSDNNVMVVPQNGYSGRFPDVLVHPASGDFPVTQLMDYSSQPYASTFDDQNNYYVADVNRNRLLVYFQPFLTPFPANTPTPLMTPTPVPTLSPTPTGTATYTISPTFTLTPTVTPTPISGCCQAVTQITGGSAGSFSGPLFWDAIAGNNLYVDDFPNNRVQEFNINNGVLTPNGAVTGLNGPYVTYAGADGYLYVGEFNSSDIKKINRLNNSVVATIPIGAQPSGIWADSNGDIYASLFGSANATIEVFPQTGNNVYSAIPIVTLVDPASNHATGLLKSGNKLYFADTTTGLIYQSTESAGYNFGAPVPVAGVTIQSPYEMASDSGGNIYVASANNGTFRTFDSGFNELPSSNCQTALVSSMPGIAVDAQGNVYGSGEDSQNAPEVEEIAHCPSVIIPTSTPTAGCCQVAWSRTAGTAGAFQAAKGVAVDGSTVYVADFSNVQAFQEDGTPVTAWSGFNNVEQIVTGLDGLLYAAEDADVRVFNAAGAAVTTLSGFGGDSLQGLSIDAANGDIYVTGNSGTAYWVQRTNAVTQTSPTFALPKTLNLGTTFPNSYGILKVGTKLYLSDINNGRGVMGFTQVGSSVTYTSPVTVVPSGSVTGQVSVPMQLAQDSLGNIYVVSNGDNRYEEYNSTFTSEIHECQVTGSNYFGIGVDAQGNVFMSGNQLARIGGCQNPMATATPTATYTPSVTWTATPDPTSVRTPTATWTPTKTPTITVTFTKTITPTLTRTFTLTPTPSKTATKIPTPTVTRTKTISPTPTKTRTLTVTPTFTKTATKTPTPTPTRTKTASPTPTVTKTFTKTQTITATPTRTKTITPTITRTPTPTGGNVIRVDSIVVGESGSPTPTETPSWTPTPVDSPTVEPSPTATPSNSLLQSVVAAPNVSNNGQPIRFQVTLTQPASLRLDLYSVSGELVYETKISGQTGLNTIQWGLKNQSFESVASGLYLYVLQIDGAGEEVRQGKVIILH
jgi:hypothetical protein